jgi:hypothetical protein
MGRKELMPEMIVATTERIEKYPRIWYLKSMFAKAYIIGRYSIISVINRDR